MSRSLKKGPYIDPRVLKKVQAVKASGKRTSIKTWSRACVISPEMVGMTFLVHNGKDFISVFLSKKAYSLLSIQYVLFIFISFIYPFFFI